MGLTILKILTFGTCEKFQERSPVLWRSTTAPAVIGYNSANLKINLISPCKLLRPAGMTIIVANKLKDKCEKQYEELLGGKCIYLRRIFCNSLLTRCCQDKDAINIPTSGKKQSYMSLSLHFSLSLMCKLRVEILV